MNMRLDSRDQLLVQEVVTEFTVDKPKMAEPANVCDISPPTGSLVNGCQNKDKFPKRSKTFVINWGEPQKQTASNLQEAFLKFQKQKKNLIREDYKLEKRKKKKRKKRGPAQIEALRTKFVEQAKKYFGVPYARKYWAKDTEEYSSPLFLDCCGLVRKVARDLEKDLGFRIGPWNQAYMYDTLPINLKENQMKPGDLVFMSGIYTNQKSKKQPHNMTHVEIWLGDGPKTIGARWNNGKVQIFDSYRFSAKSFHSEQYYFKSIVPWLKGKCKSHCRDHSWKRKKRKKLSKKSIFHPVSDQSEQNEADEAASGEEDEDGVLTAASASAPAPEDDLMYRLSRIGEVKKSASTPNFPTNQRPVSEGASSVVSQLDWVSTVSSSESSDSESESSDPDCLSPAVKYLHLSDSETDDENNKASLKLHSSASSGALPAKSDAKYPKKSSSFPDLDLDDKSLYKGGCGGHMSEAWVENKHPSEEMKIATSHLPLAFKDFIERVSFESETDFAGSSDAISLKDNGSMEAEVSAVLVSSTGCGRGESIDSSGIEDDLPECHQNFLEEQNKQSLSGGNMFMSFIPLSDDLEEWNIGTEYESIHESQKEVYSQVLDTDLPERFVYEIHHEDHLYCVVECGSENCDPSCDEFGTFEDLELSKGETSDKDVMHLSGFESHYFMSSYEEGDLVEVPHQEKIKSTDSRIELELYKKETSEEDALDFSGSESHYFVNSDKEDDLVDGSLSSFYEAQFQGSELMVGDKDMCWTSSPADGDTHESESSGQAEGGGSGTEQGANNGESNRGDAVGSDGGRAPGRGGGKKTPGGGRSTKLPTCSLANNMTPSFYIGGRNGFDLIETPLLALGWKRISDKHDEKFRLKWVECKSRINYSAFREGDQLVNHIANCQLLTNKMGLLNSLQEYERVTYATKGRLPRLKMSEFVPETYRLDNRDDRETFLRVYKESEIWISKPTGMNQGKGIFLLRSQEEINQLLSDRDAKQQQQRKVSRPLMSRIVQRYIHKPLLLEDRKFDIRAYMLISSTVPYLVLYHKGYVRLSCQKYDGNDENLSTHLTNQFIQKKVPNYCEVKEDTAWSMDKFNDYINDNVAAEKGIEENWVYNTLTKQMQRIMLHCFNSVKHKLECKVGYFDLYGLDFMVDQDMKIWLIEININPCLAINCSALKEVIPGIVEETIYLSIECFEKSRKNQPLMPLQSLKHFTILYCGANPNAPGPRQTRSVSPVKENHSERATRSTQSPPQHRQGRSPGRSIPRVSLTTTPLAQSPFVPRKSEFPSILNSQSGKGSSNVRGRPTPAATKPTTSGGSSDKTHKPNSENKNNSAKTKQDTKVRVIKPSSEPIRPKSDSTKKVPGADSKAQNSEKTAGKKIGNKTQSGDVKHSDIPSTKQKTEEPSKKKTEESSKQKTEDKRNDESKQTSKVVKQKTDTKVLSDSKSNKETTEHKNSKTRSEESVKGDNSDVSPQKMRSGVQESVSKEEPVSNSSATESLSDTNGQTGQSELVSEGAPKGQNSPNGASPIENPDDVKLKMTHATNSATRKNRPRAHTGN